MNPAREVKTERYSRNEGKTPAFVDGEVQSTFQGMERNAPGGTPTVRRVFSFQISCSRLFTPGLAASALRLSKRETTPPVGTTNSSSSWVCTFSGSRAVVRS